jgi:hypothetical protein
MHDGPKLVQSGKAMMGLKDDSRQEVRGELV